MGKMVEFKVKKVYIFQQNMLVTNDLNLKSPTNNETHLSEYFFNFIFTTS